MLSNLKKVERVEKFPMLKISVSGDIVVLFNSETSGTVVWANSSAQRHQCIGYHSINWSSSEFKEFNSEVSLENSKMGEIKLKRHSSNCVSIGSKLYSYETHVADICDTFVTELGYWSRTTRRHVKSTANELGLIFIKFNKELWVKI